MLRHRRKRKDKHPELTKNRTPTFVKAARTRPENRAETGNRRNVPPAEYRFKPGQSGNPGGRPRTKLLSEAYREELEHLDPKKRKTIAQLIAKQVIKQALKGDLAAVKEVTDRTEGRPAQQVQVSADINGTVYVIQKLKEMEDAERRVKK